MLELMYVSSCFFCNMGSMISICLQVESLVKKYEEKYKQSGDVASKLTIEEATFPLVILKSVLSCIPFCQIYVKQSYAKKIVGEENGDILGNCQDGTR